MKNIYGVKMISLEDITGASGVGRPQTICNYLRNEVLLKGRKIYSEFSCSLEVDTSLLGNATVYNGINAYKLIFIPLDVVEETFIHDSVVEPLSDIQDKVISQKRADYIDRIISSRETKLFSVQSKYQSQAQILKSTCCMFVFENDEFKDVYTAIPRTVLEDVLFKKQEYVCDDCGAKEVTDNTVREKYLPAMMYEVKENRICYYCHACAVRHKNVKNVGE